MIKPHCIFIHKDKILSFELELALELTGKDQVLADIMTIANLDFSREAVEMSFTKTDNSTYVCRGIYRNSHFILNFPSFNLPWRIRVTFLDGSNVQIICFCILSCQSRLSIIMSLLSRISCHFHQILKGGHLKRACFVFTLLCSNANI